MVHRYVREVGTSIVAHLNTYNKHIWDLLEFVKH